MKILRLIFALFIASWSSVLVAAGFSAKNSDGVTIYYNLLSSNSVEVINCPSGSEYSGSITIPDKVNYYGIEKTVTSIRKRAFMDCSNLTSIYISNGITNIGEEAFKNCIGLNSITIPSSMTSIGLGAFSGCVFTKESFINNSSLDANENYYWAAKIVDEITEDGLYIKDNIVIGCKENITSATIPNGVISIGNDAFENGKNLNSINIPNSVTSIGNRAFSGCSSLNSISLPNELNYIGSSAFYGCTSLNTLNIPSSVTTIMTEAFKGCM